MKFKNSVIVISDEIDLILKIRNNPYIFSYITKTSGIEKILEEIETLVKIKEDEKSSTEYKICNELEILHYNFSYVGTQYLFEAILLSYKANLLEDIRLEKTIYPIIAKKYKKSVNNIKTNIINSTNLMYYDCDSEILNSYFKIYDNEKPTPKVVISTIISKLKYDL